MKKNSAKNMHKRFESYINTASKEDIDRILILLDFVDKATPDETKFMKEQLKNENFNVREWIDSKRSLTMEGV